MAKATKRNTRSKTKASAGRKRARKRKPAEKVKLRKPQIRILQAMSRTDKCLVRAAIADRAECDYASLTDYIGAHDEAKRRANDVRYFPSLLTLGYITYGPKEVDDDSPRYRLTAAGRKALQQATSS